MDQAYLLVLQTKYIMFSLVIVPDHSLPYLEEVYYTPIVIFSDGKFDRLDPRSQFWQDPQFTFNSQKIFLFHVSHLFLLYSTYTIVHFICLHSASRNDQRLTNSVNAALLYMLTVWVVDWLTSSRQQQLCYDRFSPKCL